MGRRSPPPEGYDDNPEWNARDFADAAPASTMLPPGATAALVRKGGRPAGSNKEQVSLRLDKDILAKWRASGSGWQSRMNEALRKTAP